MKSSFVISLDFELIWGMHEGDIVNSDYIHNIRGGREAIPKLLELFKKYGIHATWATVGLLFADNLADAKKYFPGENLQPTYKNMSLSPYPLMDTVTDENSALYFAPDLISQIAATRGAGDSKSHLLSLLLYGGRTDTSSVRGRYGSRGKDCIG